MARPAIKLQNVADNYAHADVERIAEFNGNDPDRSGGLIALRRVDAGENESGHVRLDVYRTDPNVRVAVGQDTPTFMDGVEVNNLVAWWRSLTTEERALTGVDHVRILGEDA